MKNVLILALGISSASPVFAGMSTSLKTLSHQTRKIYHQINSSKEVDAGMFGLDFYSKNKAKSEAKKSVKCNTQTNYKNSSGDNVVSRMVTHQRQALDDGMILNPDLVPSEDDLDRLTIDWVQELDAEEIKICVIRDTPAYTDGREITFVMVNGSVEFAFGFTKPD